MNLRRRLLVATAVLLQVLLGAAMIQSWRGAKISELGQADLQMIRGGQCKWTSANECNAVTKSCINQDCLNNPGGWECVNAGLQSKQGLFANLSTWNSCPDSLQGVSGCEAAKKVYCQVFYDCAKTPCTPTGDPKVRKCQQPSPLIYQFADPHDEQRALGSDCGPYVQRSKSVSAPIASANGLGFDPFRRNAK